MGAKPACAKVSETERLENESRAIIDEFGKIEDLLVPVKPIIKRREELRAQILAAHGDLPAHASLSIFGSLYEINISRADQQRFTTIEGRRKLRKLWGVEQFLQLCSVAVKNLPGGKDPDDIYSVSQRTGPRHLTSTLRRQAA